MQYKKISSETIHSNPWWDYNHDQYSLKDGSEGDYYYAKTKGAVMMLPILDNGKLILVRQYRYLCEKNSIEFPCGGKINEDESALEAAARELKEETGYVAADYVKIGDYEPNLGYTQDNTAVFVATELQQVGEPENSAEEVIEVMYRRVDEFDAMIKRGEIIDGMTLAAWALSREYVYNLLD